MYDELLFIGIRGLGLGGMLALIALSLNVIYQATHILNFAQGGLFVVAALVGIAFSDFTYGNAMWFVGLVIAGGLLAAGVAVQGIVTLWPLRHSTEQQSWLITTLSVSIIISAVLLLVLGPWSSEFRSRVPGFRIAGMRTPVSYLVLPALALAWYIGLRLFSRFSLTGLALSALSQDPEAAAAAGLRVRRLQVLSFAISGLIVGTGGYAAAPIISVSPDAAIGYVIAGFVVAVVGGIGNLTGAIVAGPLIGLVTVFATFRFGGQYEGLFSLVILTLVLQFRPSGLFGVKTARRF